VDNVVYLVLRDDLIVSLKVSHIELLVAAWQVDLLIADISSDHIIFTDNFAKCIDKGYTNLTLATGNKNFSSMLNKIKDSYEYLPKHERSSADRRG
jgi:hypothetical protein